jgi:hypothetical protein
VSRKIWQPCLKLDFQNYGGEQLNADAQVSAGNAKAEKTDLKES